MESTIHDVLIHRNPQQDDNGNFQYEVLKKIIIYSFASKYILIKLTNKYKDFLITEAKEKFLIGTSFGGEDGKQFERLCLHVCKFSDKKFSANPLDKTENLISFDIQFPESEYLVRNWSRNSVNLRENVLYLPTIENLESGDAFCVKELNGVSTLIVLQITIADKHPVKINGLDKINNYFVNAGVPITDKILIFVTPVNGKLTRKQNLTTTKGTDSTNVSADMVAFCNNQFKIEFILE
jgi:hypothetical protein